MWLLVSYIARSERLINGALIAWAGVGVAANPKLTIDASAGIGCNKKMAVRCNMRHLTFRGATTEGLIYRSLIARGGTWASAYPNLTVNCGISIYANKEMTIASSVRLLALGDTATQRLIDGVCISWAGARIGANA